MEDYKNKEKLHVEFKIKEWSRKESLSKETIKSLEKSLLEGALTLALQPVHALKNSLEQERTLLAKAQKWRSHWVSKL